MQNNFRGDYFNILPPVVKNLLILNGLCMLIGVVLQERFGISFIKQLGLYYPESSFFKPFQFITHIFVHADYGHLLSNMFSLFIYGTVLENFLGGKRFLTFYLVTAFGAAFLYLFVDAIELMQLKSAVNYYLNNISIDGFVRLIDKDWYLAHDDNMNEFIGQWQTQPNNLLFKEESIQVANMMVERKINIPIVGASGAVYGLMLGAATLFPNRIVFPLFLPLKYIVLIHGIQELYSAFYNNPTDNVAHFAHLGGMLFGFILIKWWNKTRRDTFY